MANDFQGGTARQKEKRNTTEKSHGCKGQGEVEADDRLW